MKLYLLVILLVFPPALVRLDTSEQPTPKGSPADPATGAEDKSRGSNDSSQPSSENQK
jgi:hypothetical protein